MKQNCGVNGGCEGRGGGEEAMGGGAEDEDHRKLARFARVNGSGLVAASGDCGVLQGGVLHAVINCLRHSKPVAGVDAFFAHRGARPGGDFKYSRLLLLPGRCEEMKNDLRGSLELFRLLVLSSQVYRL